MAWTPYYSGGWQSGEEGGTPITPDALNHMDDGIAGAVERTGDEMSGNLTVPRLNVKSGGRFSNIFCLDSDGVPRAMMWSDGQSGRIFFRSINPNVSASDVDSIYTEYYLYQSTLTSGNASYRIYSERDTIPVDHGGTGATGGMDAAENIGVALSFGDSGVTLAAMYPRMVKVPVAGTAMLWLHSTAASLLSGGKITSYCTCIASRTNSANWRFMAFTGAAEVYTWTLSGWSSASATPTIGTVYKLTGTAI